MKPITDETIESLIERADRRQKASRPANIAAPLSGKASGNSKSSRIISLDFVRRPTITRRTVSGVFFYAPRT